MSVTSLSGVPETMLWTLHNRAGEAQRSDGVLDDPKCVEIYKAIPYNYERSFGPSEPSHAVRALAFDEAICEFITRHPDGVIVNLGEGLETQRYRVDGDEGVLWLSVDVPEAMEVRERYISADARHRHVAKSALDTSWFDEVPEGRPVFVTAQGLFMYFDEPSLRGLLQAMAKRWPGVEVMFDYVPEWLSKKSQSEKGWRKTPHYRVPPLPWGINRPDLLPTLRSWVSPQAVEDVGCRDFDLPRGSAKWLIDALTLIPWVRNRAPGIARVRLGTPTPRAVRS